MNKEGTGKLIKDAKKEADTDLWNEIVLELKLQRQGRRKQLLCMAVCGISFLFIAGLSFFIFSGGDTVADIFGITGMAVVMILTIIIQRNMIETVQGKWMRTGRGLSIAGGVYAVLLLLAAVVPVIFRYRISGLLLHYQLCAIWLIQMGWLLVCSFMVLKQEGQMTIWMLVAEDVILFVLLCDNLFHCLTDSMEEITALLLGKLSASGVILAVALLVNCIVRKRCSISREKTAA